MARTAEKPPVSFCAQGTRSAFPYFYPPFAQKGFSMLPTQSPVIDVRTLEPRERHVQIFGKFDAMRAGEALQIVNDHDPVPLRHQLESRAPGQVQWAYLESGPAQWRVLISKLEAKVAEEAGSCCSGGACGG